MANYYANNKDTLVGAIAQANATTTSDNIYFQNDIVLGTDVTLDLSQASNNTGTLRFRGGLPSVASPGNGVPAIPGSNIDYKLTIQSALNVPDTSPLTAQPSFTIGLFTLQIGNGGTAGSLSGNLRADDGGTLVFNRSADTTYTGTLSVEDEDNGLRNDFAGTLLTLDGSLGTPSANNGPGLAIRASQNTGDASGYELSLGGAGNGLISGIIADSGFLSITRTNTANPPVTTTNDTTGNIEKEGDGTWTFSAANTYVGVTSVEEGTLVVANGAGLGATIATSVTYDSTGTLTSTVTGTAAQSGTEVGDGATLALTGGISVGAEALSLEGDGVAGDGPDAPGAGALQNRSGSNSFAGAITLADDASIRSAAGTLTLTGGINGAHELTLGGDGNGVIATNGIGADVTGVVKEDDGTWTLSATNTYTGATTVGGGTLLVNGSISGSVTTVEADATLGGTGTLGAVSVEEDGTFAAGSAANGGIGQITTGNLTLEDGAIFVAQVGGSGAGTSYDQTVVNGTVSLDGAVLDLEQLADYDPARGTAITLIDASDTVTGHFVDEDGAEIDEGGTVAFGDREFVVSYAGGADGHDVTLTVQNGDPVAVDDAKAVTQRLAVSGNVLTNDTDIDDDTLSVTSVTFGDEDTEVGSGTAVVQGDHGMLVIQANGSYSYVASTEGGIAVGETLDDTFVYAVSDGHGGTAEAELTVSVTGSAIGNGGANIFELTGPGTSASGLGGNDVYYVDGANDTVTEAANGGNDRVYASVSYTLGAGQSIETLSTTDASDTAAINLTGNALVQTIIGNAGANTLNGKEGADTLSGLGGNDLYYVDNAGDQVIEAANGGTDRVYANVSYTLASGQSIESLNTTNSAGTSAIDLTGNEQRQTISGNAGINQLDGKAGADILYGNGGADTFVFSTALTSVDTIRDFSTDDTIQLNRSIFTAFQSAGTLDQNAFKDIGVSGAKVDADDRIIYNHNTGALSYDADGSGTASKAIQFATLTNKAALAFDDFLIA